MGHFVLLRHSKLITVVVKISFKGFSGKHRLFRSVSMMLHQIHGRWRGVVDEASLQNLEIKKYFSRSLVHLKKNREMRVFFYDIFGIASNFEVLRKLFSRLQFSEQGRKIIMKLFNLNI